MTGFELLYSCLRPFEHPLYQHVWRTIRGIATEGMSRVTLLDVGGRRSNYTIGLAADVWITDVPRERAIQEQLDLGATDEIQALVLKRRSNITRYVYDNMTATTLQEGRFGVITAIEVLEHVEDDMAFLANVRRLLSPDGTFVMSTPNGDFIPVPYPDHKRHYTLSQLKDLLGQHFGYVDVEYRVNSGLLFTLGCRRWSLKAPLRTLAGMCAFFAADKLESASRAGVGSGGKLHLVAICRP